VQQAQLKKTDFILQQPNKKIHNPNPFPTLISHHPSLTLNDKQQPKTTATAPPATRDATTCNPRPLHALLNLPPHSAEEYEEDAVHTKTQTTPFWGLKKTSWTRQLGPESRVHCDFTESTKFTQKTS